VVEVLGLPDDAPLAMPPDDARTTVAPEARRLVAYAVPDTVPDAVPDSRGVTLPEDAARG
jgi:hypothetical protein